MLTVRDIIVESLNRANIVSRRQGAPADMMETGLRLLKSLAARYSNDNLLQFLREETVFDLRMDTMLIGDMIDPDMLEHYYQSDVFANDIQKIASVYIRPKQQSAANWIEMQYVAFEDFDNCNYGSNIYTYQQRNDKQLTFKVRNAVVGDNMECKIIWNRKWNFDMNSELRVPEQYNELFITALTHKLALTFPRLTSEQTNLLKADLTEMENNLMTSTRAQKIITRSMQPRACNLSDFVAGRFLGI